MQFFFDRHILGDVTEENPTGTPVVVQDSFNTDCVIMTVGLPNGKRQVYLNDGHVESRYDFYPNVDKRTGKTVGKEYRKEASWYQYNIILEKEDSDRYVELFNKLST